MDPDATLAQIRAQLAAFDTPGWPPPFDVTTLVDAVAALDQWLTRGGFLPTAWDPPTPMCPHGHGPLQNGDCPDCGYAL
jgi:hypothetical protein